MNTPKVLAAALAAAFGVCAALAQSADSQRSLAVSSRNTSTNDEAPDNELVRLTPFEISERSNVGYAATETLAGTRIRTQLRDVGSAISVVTREFMDDIGATDNTTLLQYVTNAEVGGTRSTYGGFGNGTSLDEEAALASPHTNNRVRGLSAADNTRDYFGTDIPWDGFNIDRVDIQRGPNSILFGLGKPAGIINASLRNAEFRNAHTLDLRFGSHDSRRASLDINRELIQGTLALRISGLWDHEKFKQHPAFEDDERVYAALRYDPKLFERRGFHTSLRAKFEHGDIKANRPRSLPPIDRLSPWFRSATPSPENPFGGMGRLTLRNGFTAEREDTPPIGGDGMGQARASDPDFNPWVTGRGDGQQPLYFIDGSTGQLYRLYGDFANNGARNPDGTIRTNNAATIGRRYSRPFYGINGLPGYATQARLPGYEYGQYREQTLSDPSIFDFYNTLIDGPNKSEREDWDAFNLSFAQTGWDDRFGIELSYDRQDYAQRNQSFLGYQPALEIDILEQFQDLQANPNLGRPFVQSAGRGSSYKSQREYRRGSLFAELRAEDFIKADWLRRLVNKQHFNGVYSAEKFKTERRTWIPYASPQSWDDYQTLSLGLFERPPLAINYLGDSLLGQSLAAGAAIPGITAPLDLRPGPAYHFNTTWNANLPFGAPFTPPPGMESVYDAEALTQASNLDNYIGWNSAFNYEVLRYADGDQRLTRSAAKALRRTQSYAGSWQGYWWDGAFVTTLGWRYDVVRGKDVQAPATGPRNTIDLGPTGYSLPGSWNSEFKSHSLSKSTVVHLNTLFGGPQHDPLPLNVSLSYSESENFEISGTRRNLYGEVIDNPTGKTRDYGVLLATKDNRYSLRVTKYEARVTNATTQVGDLNILGNIIVHGLRWRNVFLYDLNAYTLDTANGPNTWRYNYEPDTAAGETQDDADAREAAAVAAWNEIQAWLPPQFFEAWGFQPPADLANPDPANVYAYGPDSPPPGFAMTSDTLSKGYEFELTANPTRNWRLAFNAAKTTATRLNVGSAETVAFVNYMNEKIAGAAGDLRQFAGGPTANTMRINWNNGIGAYTLMKLQEGSAASELRRWRYTLVTNYAFTRDFLKGVSLGASYRWQDKVVIGYLVIEPTPGQYTFDLARPYYGPSEDALDLWIGYERKLGTRLGWKIQLNVRNAFANNRLIPISVQPDGRTWAAARIAPGQEWFITNSFSF